ncbi:MAG TPA: cell division protein FtsA [Opitutaceae bacterium]|nr:cell division protein FtsA [Opitutaceae bacterium]
MISSTRIIGAVEIGTTKITVLVGEFTRARELSIIGVGEAPSRGIIKGAVMDYKAASEATHSALLAAEQSAGTRVDEIYLAQTGGHLEGFENEASVNVSAADNTVSAIDLETVCRLAMAKELPEGRIVVHHIRRPFRLDGRLVPEPEHLVGRRLDVSYWTVHGLESKVADNTHVINGFNVRVTKLILSSLASGALVTTAEERHNGVLALDIGGGTTDFVLYRDGCAHRTGVLPVGGGHLTNDLALGLRVLQAQAEELKVRHGRAVVQARDRREKVMLIGDYSIGDREFPRQTIEQITSARIWEIFDVVRKKLGASFAPEKIPAGVVLTGGTARLPGITEAAAKVFGAPARLGEAPGWVSENLRDPGYSTVLGLLHFTLTDQSGRAAAPRRRGGLLSKLFATA